MGDLRTILNKRLFKLEYMTLDSEENRKKMTMEDIERELGYEVELIN